MRVAFDASELGSKGQTGQRGIRRVAHNLAVALSAHPDIQMAFTGITLEDARRLARVLQQPLDHEVFPCVGNVLSSALMEFGEKFLGSTNRRPQRAFITRLARRIVRALISPVQENSRSFCPRALKAADIVHSPYGPLPDKEWEVPAFITIYDLIPVLYPALVQQATVRTMEAIIASLRPNIWVMSISEHVKQDLCAFTGFPAERVFAVPLAASRRTFYRADCNESQEVRKRYGLNNVPYILSLSAMDVRKNLDHLLTCFATLIEQEDVGELRLVLVGANADGGAKLSKLIRENAELTNRVVLTGFVPDDDLAGLYSGATAFAFPSLAEGFGLPVLEGMQCGVPVISSNRTSLPEVVGDAGLLLDPLDKDAWCDAILNIYRNAALRKDLQRRSMARAEFFSWEKTADTLIGAYKRAIAAG